MRTASALALAATLLAAPAFAQDRPPLFPTRDVAVTYRISGGPQPGGEISMAWMTRGQMLRVDMPGGLGFMIADQQNNRGFMVMEAQRTIMDIPPERAAGHQAAMRNARFTRQGNDTVAGLPCTVWRFETGQQNGVACITADGVMLRSQTNVGGNQVTMEAARVDFAAQSAARFERPQGYQSMRAPQMPPPGALPPPGAGQPPATALPPKPN